ncbi:MAG: family metallopeptidase [Caulobacteraceae bacterium]|nr:family metallopeptidase [Caulobacteraceae bacterium]
MAGTDLSDLNRLGLNRRGLDRLGLNRRGLILGFGAASLAGPTLAAAAAPPTLALSGRYVQSGFAIGKTAPRAKINLDGEDVGLASATGYFVVGFDRDAKPSALLTVSNAGGEATHSFDIAPTDYDIQRIDGLPQETVTPTGEALLKRIVAEAARKQVGFASLTDTDNFKTGFASPLETYRLSARFGGQRIDNGVPQTPHYGIDLAAPIGTPIHAPGDGLVCFAETGMFYEGGLTFIDHGQGLVSMYLHQSKVLVKKGQLVKRGQKIGEDGMDGRATGPHLCWRMKWRKRNMDPMELVGANPPVPRPA